MARPRGSRFRRTARDPARRSGSRLRRGGAVRRSRRASIRSPVDRARGHLRAYRKASVVAIALTGFLLLFLDSGGTSTAVGQEPAVAESIPDTVSVIQQVPLEELRQASEEADTTTPRADSLTRESAEEAQRTLRGLWISFLGNLPKIGIALAVFLAAALLVRLLRPLLRRVLGQWERADAFTALIGIGVWLVAIGVAFSVLAGDIRALLGSLGLIGLALSWALQTPIESFTGWMLNSFRGYYRVGDRIAVGDVFGDVYRIDLLTTTVWEYGGPDRPPGSVRAEQPTGRLITFPNNEVLTGTIVNYTRDFPYVWDEVTVAVGPESDVRYALGAIRRVADEVVGEPMTEPARRYGLILGRMGLAGAVPERPEVFVALGEWSVDVVIRYLVGAREKRRWKSELSLRVAEELNRPEHAGRILPAYPRRQVQPIGPDGVPREVGTPPDEAGRTRIEPSD